MSRGGPQDAAYRLDAIRFRYPGSDRDAIADLSAEIGSGGHTIVIGPNGAGKSTLFRLMTGTLDPRSGGVTFRGKRVGAWDRRSMARLVGVVSQETPPSFPFSVRAFVELGRNPHLRPWQSLRGRDRDAVRAALARTDLAHLDSRDLATLSGGELQRAKLARALAQEPEVLLLDEPTAHLDVGHEMRIFELVADLVRVEGLTAVSVTHNLHLASRFADRILLLSEGRLIESGSVETVMSAENLGRAFGWPLRVVPLDRLGLQIVPLPGGER